MTTKVKHLILVAERREIEPLIKMFEPLSDRYFEGNIGANRVGVYITGVGKNAVKRSMAKVSEINADEVWNVGNVGALSPFPSGLMVRLGRVVGQNGSLVKEVESESPFMIVTVNSLQNKSKLAEQYPQAHVVDMEASHWLAIYPKLKIIKVVLDRSSDIVRAPVKGFVWFWRIRQNAKRLSTLLLHELSLDRKE